MRIGLLVAATAATVGFAACAQPSPALVVRAGSLMAPSIVHDNTPLPDPVSPMGPWPGTPGTGDPGPHYPH